METIEQEVQEDDGKQKRKGKLITPRPTFTRTLAVAKIIHIFGGVKNVARICKCTESAVYKWQDNISFESAWRLLAYARQKGYNEVTLEMLRPDFDYGNRRNKVEES